MWEWLIHFDENVLSISNIDFEPVIESSNNLCLHCDGNKVIVVLVGSSFNLVFQVIDQSELFFVQGS